MVIPSSAANTFSSADPGFAVLTVDEMLTANADIVARIKLCYGTDRDSFETDVLALIRRYAAYVHLLPATADNYFSAPGGLLRLGLETGFFSLQGTDAHIFSGRSTITTRRLLEPRWRHATFIAGLCCEVHRVLSHIIVTDAKGEVWSGYLQPLSDWLTARGATRYFLSWRPQAIETRSLSVFALPHVVPPQVLKYLSEDNAIIVPHLMASISGMPAYRDHNVLDGLVRRSLALVIDRNLTANADRYGSPQFGSHLERYLVDALRRLASSDSAWVCNHDKSRVWFGQDGLFLLWPNAADDVRKLLEADQLPGIPKAVETMLELLLAAEVFEAQDAAHSIWTIYPPSAKTVLEAVKLTSASILFAGIDPLPKALDMKLVRRPGAPDASPPPATPQRPARPGEQLSLMPSVVSPSAEKSADERLPELSHPTPSVKSSPAAPRDSFTLQAPLRLNPVVRDALATVVHTLNEGAGPAQGCTTAQGFFVPLNEFERRGLQPFMALHALADVGMLVPTSPGGPPTFARDFNGARSVGIVVDPRFIAGFDLDGFALQDSENH
ncbi:MobH family relaxase [Rhodoferax sediminis]|uniref:Relaxase n=1 Tax=Rhodoferax sediminis TaxID=2509614 RepID=A0A515DE78_9BURK|nr:MobH family relaxase [Rhodoferax sediminis]QDL38721.1 relaxase [Rhodoferax sediminis]